MIWFHRGLVLFGLDYLRSASSKFYTRVSVLLTHTECKCALNDLLDSRIIVSISLTKHKAHFSRILECQSSTRARNIDPARRWLLYIYLPEYQGLTQKEVDDKILAMLMDDLRTEKEQPL